MTITEATKYLDADQKTLVRAVIRRIGMESIWDVNNYGINGGFSGFIYTGDTVAFWRKYRHTISAILADDADSMGEDILSLVQSFGCLGPDYSLQEIGRALYGNYNSDLDTIYNALAWYAAEWACRLFDK
jgi:hypothetical protein